MDFIDKGALRDELTAAAENVIRAKASMPAATAALIAAAIEHIVKRVGAELTALQRTNEALAQLAAAMPDRLASLESRIVRLEANSR